MHTLVYLRKTKFYYRTCDFAQNGVQVEKFMTTLRPIRGDASFKPQLILYLRKTRLFESAEGVW